MNSEIFDYIIIGTGMGAGPLGLKLTEAGQKVLFLEKGLGVSEQTLKGTYAESYYQKTGDLEALRLSGRFSEIVMDQSRHKKLLPFIGMGVGGSTALYGRVLERFSPDDFAAWPISYENLQRYYEEAESLFNVTRAQKLEHPGNIILKNYLNDQGFNVECLPMACDKINSCLGCQGYLCAKNCKMEAGKVGIWPAVDEHGATLVTNCNVQRILSTEDSVTGVECLIDKKTFTYRGKNIILAAGALSTPIILLNSKSAEWPHGLGNQSGLVGRFLMRHYADIYALKLDLDPKNPISKEIGFGVMQSFGRLPPPRVIARSLHTEIKINYGSLAAWVFQFILPFYILILKIFVGDRLVLASLLEDQPHFENRVWSENGKIFLHYKISPDDKELIKRTRLSFKKLFKRFGLVFIATSEKNEMLAHVCGTCRMGLDPKNSVVDTDNRVHGIKNLYVVDASFFVTSGKTNPALTIAANSLRVADKLLALQKAR